MSLSDDTNPPSPPPPLEKDQQHPKCEEEGGGSNSNLEKGASSSSSSTALVKIIQASSSNPEWESLIQNSLHLERKPVIIRGLNIGPCLEKWTPSYLIDNCPSEKKVKVHKSQEKRLDFRRKNFIYDTISFRELVQLCAGIEEESIDKEKYSYYWYLRSLGEDPRGRDVSDISIHFPTLAKDLHIPEVFFQKESFFSSVFRITSPQLQLWTHYDSCDNILIQIRGRKRIVFYPPKEALNLYLDGDKSEVVDVDQPDLDKFPKFADATRLECILEEGDIVFIPALWFHNVTALDYSVSVNVFWKNLDSDLYDKKDPYGNKDLIPAQLGYRTLDKIINQLHILPQEYQDFYLRRMIIRLEKRLAELNSNNDEVNKSKL